MSRSVPFALAAGLLIATAVAMHVPLDAITQLRHTAFDAMQRLMPRQAASQPAIVIDIDEESQRRLGSWPWPRDRVAELVSRLRAAGAAAIAFDIVFTDPDPTSPSQSLPRLIDLPLVQDLARRLPDNDRVLAEAIAGAPVVTAFGLRESASRFAGRQPAGKAAMAVSPEDATASVKTYQGALPTLPELEEAAAGNGMATVRADGDGILRRLPLIARQGERLYPSLAAEAVRVALGADGYTVTGAAGSVPWAVLGVEGPGRVETGRVSWPVNRDGSIFLHVAPTGSVVLVPAWRVLDGSADARQLAGAIAIIGSTSPDLGEQAALPTGGLASAVIVQAQAVAQLASASHLTRPDWLTPLEIALALAAGVVVAAVALLRGLRPAAALWLAALGGIGAGAGYAFAQMNLVTDPLSPALAVSAAFAIAGIARFRDEREERQRIRGAFSARVPQDVLHRLLADPDLVPYDGESRTCSFVHVRDPGFPGLLKGMAPEAVFGLLTEYTEDMAAIVLRHGAMMGGNPDGAVTALFSAPIESADHANAALACAHDMAAYSARFTARVGAAGGRLREAAIGVDSGTMVLGGTGGDALLDNLVFGQPLAAAATLAAAAARLGIRVCASGRTVVLSPGFTGRPVGHVAIPGEEEAVEGFEPLEARLMSDPGVRAYDAAYTLLSRGDKAAEAAFRQLVADHPDDAVAAYHLRRLAAGATDTAVYMADPVLS